MKILPVSLLNYNKTATEQRPIPENNRNSYFRFRNPGLLGLPHDTCTFSGKIASIVTPTMEDLINKTKASDIVRSNILRLAKYKIPCPCCGHIMLDLDRYNKFEQKVMSTTTPKTLLKFISELGAYLHPVEAKVLDMMKSVHYTNPDMTLQDILRSKLKRSEKKLIMQQSKTFVTLGMLSRKLPQDTGEEVKGLINETYDRLFDQRETSRFSRKVFIGKLEAILDKVKDDSLKSEFIQEAVKLPTAYNSPDAFIVKYAKRNYKGANPDQKIALRMLSNSLATIEHIKPQKLKGGNSPENLALECACDNNRRNHSSIIEQILQNPSMLINYQRYMDRLSELHLKGVLEKSYITQTNKSYKLESGGLLESDLSKLKYTEPSRKTRKVKSGITPTIAERREQRKTKLKTKKTWKHNHKK